MFEQTFKNIDDILFKDAGCGSELDYVEQTSWVLFLKYLDNLEKDKATAAELTGKVYKNIIAPEYQWSIWAAPKLADDKIDHNAMTGDDLVDFVNGKLFPYLKKFKTSAENANTIEYKIGEIFSELKNKIQSGYNLREVINYVDALKFRTYAEKHEMSHLYEDKIKNMGNAGRNGGEYYTPRPLITTIVKVVSPKIGDKIYDGAVGSAGFLCEAFDYLKSKKNLSTKDVEILQKNTFYGKEKKSLAYIIGTMNMILHGVEAPNIIHTNTLSENISLIQEKDRFDVVLANPPFGGKERAEVQQNFPIKSSETAYLFLQHFVKMLKAGGRAGIVIKSTFLSNGDASKLRSEFFSSCNVHTILELPSKVFTAGVKTVVLFFEKGAPTKNIWYYQLNLDRNLGKTNAINEKDFSEFISLQKTKAESKNSWNIDLKKIDQVTLDLSPRNPNKEEAVTVSQPGAIMKEISLLDQECLDILSIDFGTDAAINNLDFPSNWTSKKLGEICNIELGRTPYRADKSNWDKEKLGNNVWLSIADLLKTSGDVVSDSKEYISDKAVKTSKIVKKGTLLLSFKLTLGRLAFSGKDLFTNEAIAALTIKNQSEIDKHFLYQYLSLFDWDAATEGDVKVKGKTLNKAKLKEIVVYFPKTLSDQHQIVASLNKSLTAIASAKIKVVQKIAKLDQLKKSVLHRAFSNN